LMADAIAAKREVIVRLVMAGLEAALGDKRGHVTTSQSYQGLRRIVDQRRKSIEPGASNHVQQNGFSEVVHGVASQRSYGQDAAPFAPRASLEIRPRRDDHVVHYDGYIEPLCEGGDELRIGGAGGACVVIDVMHSHVESGITSEKQEPE